MQSHRLLVRTQAPGFLSSLNLTEVGLEPTSEAGLVILRDFSLLQRTVENGAGVSSSQHLQKYLPGLSVCIAEKVAGNWAQLGCTVVMGRREVARTAPPLGLPRGL